MGVCGVVLSVGLFGTGWFHAADVLSDQARRTGSIGPAAWLADAGLPHRAMLLVLGGLLALVLLALARDALRAGRRHLSIAGTALAGLQGWLNPWYALWGGSTIGAEDAPMLAIPVSVVLSAIVLSDAIPR
jgi:hypothetical protein